MSSIAQQGNVLADCRLASKRSFDVLKYDIYNKDTPRNTHSNEKLFLACAILTPSLLSPQT
eukprot:3673026-Amphidinium_carterae.1